MAAAPVPAQLKSNYSTFVINVSAPLQASLFDTKAFIEFLTTNFKPTKGGKAGNVGLFDATQTKEQNLIAYQKSVIISSNATGARVLIHTKTPLSKQYVKFMTKKFLKKSDLRDHLQVRATGKFGLKLQFYKVKGDDEEEEAPAAEENVE